MLEGLILIYIIISVVMLIPFASAIDNIMDNSLETELKVKHIILAILFPFTIIVLLVVIGLMYLVFVVVELFSRLKFLDKTVWRKK